MITGLNGAGKSHLLKALRDGAARIDIAPSHLQEVRLFDWGNLVPNDEGDFASETITAERLQLSQALEGLYRQPWGHAYLSQQAMSQGITGQLLADVHALVTASENILEESCTSGTPGTSLKATITAAHETLQNNIINNLSAEHRVQVQEIARLSRRSVATLRREDVTSHLKPSWGQAELFQHSFGRLFVAYRDMQLFNQIAQNAQSKGREVHVLTDEQFVEQYGEKPWDFVNASLEAAGLDFRIASPDEWSLSPYRARLNKVGSSVEISFSELSSGERVLMSFAFALYYARDSRQQISRPKVLLFDEIDAPLHPSMCRSLLATVRGILVEQYGMKVIMTTHSPSTVALAPEESIHVMKAGQPGVHKCSKDTALKDLTFGVPFLSVSYDGRRQVFVESPYDADVYQPAFNALRRRLSSDVSLVFIASGGPGPSGTHANTGCAAVRTIVSTLRSAGATNTLGLIDWDGKNAGGDGVHVLAEGERDGSENVFFDPLLLLNALVRHCGGDSSNYGLPPGELYTTLDVVNADVLQNATDFIQEKVLGRIRSTGRSVAYVGGFTLEVDRDYLLMDDHALEQSVSAAFPRLREISKGRPRQLMSWIANTIITERPDHTPLCLLEAFRVLCAA